MTKTELLRFNRIDVLKGLDCVQIWFFEPGERQAQEKNYYEKPKDFELVAFLKIVESIGWTVRQWDNGARAFKGEPFPIRSATQIIKIRDRLTAEAVRNGGTHPRGLDLKNLDLAYDL